MKLERRAAEYGRVDIGRRNAEILGERQSGGAGLRRRTKQPVDIAQIEAAIRQRPADTLRHEVDDVHSFGDVAEIAFCCADDRRAAALQSAHAASPTGTKTG